MLTVVCNKLSVSFLDGIVYFVYRSFSTTSVRCTKDWMYKHATDPYVRRSYKENYRARSAFKLIEINKLYNFIKPGHCVIDMGASPGAWSQVLAKQVNVKIHKKSLSSGNVVVKPAYEKIFATEDLVQTHYELNSSLVSSSYISDQNLKFGTVIALDREPMFEIAGVHIIDDWELKEDTFRECEQRLNILLTKLNIDKVNGIVSDMCPNITGHSSIDHPKIAELQNQALLFARKLLKQDGYFLCKMFNGDYLQELRTQMNEIFNNVHLIRPSATRNESSETYILGLKYKEEKEKSSSKQTEHENLVEEAKRVRRKKPIV
ncbi:unnamed protein product [Didymodactylos carnosus]|uniref:rRNA methyltransferase 2, mitochondrial n=1 Tax=Didymodactylos carnosus TaxID=1234261 RepID=A0A8S2GSK6_9BILA|nr:unnamed protein product [Didymodactylos carnosus]CAF3556160.1 unnamed protein product [Didymodactylos carnosus]